MSGYPKLLSTNQFGEQGIDVVRSPNGIVYGLEGSGAPVDGVSGTGAGVAGKGSEYVDYASGEHYFNTGTKASPAWKLVTHA